MLTIAQITDLHITNGSQPKDRVRNAARLRTVLKSIYAMKPRPAAILFDFGGTLDGPGLTWKTRAFRLYRSAGLAPAGK